LDSLDLSSAFYRPTPLSIRSRVYWQDKSLNLFP
jgi:hypothetical protein